MVVEKSSPNPWPADKVERWDTNRLVRYARNSRTHSPQQIDAIAASIREWGWTSPILIDEDGTILAGHGRADAARKLKLPEVPVMVARGWSDAQKRAYVIADNRLQEKGSSWDVDMLLQELGDIQTDGLIDLTVVGFDKADMESLLHGIAPPTAGIDTNLSLNDASETCPQCGAPIARNNKRR